MHGRKLQVTRHRVEYDDGALNFESLPFEKYAFASLLEGAETTTTPRG
jgi:hypothetical protein